MRKKPHKAPNLSSMVEEVFVPSPRASSSRGDAGARFLRPAIRILGGFAVFGLLVNLGSGNLDFAICSGAMAAACVILELWARADRAIRAARHAYIVVVVAGVTAMVLLAGSARSGLLSLFFVLPLTVTLILGPRGLVIWTPLLVGLVVELEDGALGALRLAEGPLLAGPPSIMRSLDLVAALLAVASTAWVFDRVQRRALDMAEASARRLALEVEERREAELRACRAARAKSDFLAMMSHEIRTPLNGILGIAESLRTAELERDVREQVDIIDASGRSLLVVLDDVLDFSKIEAGKLSFDERPFALSRLARQVTSLVEPKARAKGLALSCRLDPELPSWVLGDDSRISQIASNLLSNAVKFTERGEVRWQVGPSPEGGVRFEIHDTGIGIAPEALAKLFQPFEQAEASTTRRFGGTGLGLSISHRLVALMGGTLCAESRIGEGSCFRFELPLRPTEAPAGSAEGAPPLARLELDGPVLVVDDNRVNRVVARRLLERLGAEVEEADSGEAAVARVRDGGPVAAVLMDVQMPTMDGYEATRRLRQLPGGAELVVIGLSANALPEDRRRAAAATMNAYLTKPVRSEALQVALQGDAGGVAPA